MSGLAVERVRMARLLPRRGTRGGVAGTEGAVDELKEKERAGGGGGGEDRVFLCDKDSLGEGISRGENISMGRIGCGETISRGANISCSEISRCSRGGSLGLVS